RLSHHARARLHARRHHPRPRPAGPAAVPGRGTRAGGHRRPPGRRSEAGLSMLAIVPGVTVRRDVDPRRLGWITPQQAATRRGLTATRSYVDLRGFRRIDLDAVLAEEDAGYRELEAAGFDQKTVDAIDRRQAAEAVVRIVDFGVAAAVVALSALGCVPI